MAGTINPGGHFSPLPAGLLSIFRFSKPYFD